MQRRHPIRKLLTFLQNLAITGKRSPGFLLSFIQKEKAVAEFKERTLREWSFLMFAIWHLGSLLMVSAFQFCSERDSPFLLPAMWLSRGNVFLCPELVWQAEGWLTAHYAQPSSALPASPVLTFPILLQQAVAMWHMAQKGHDVQTDMMTRTGASILWRKWKDQENHSSTSTESLNHRMDHHCTTGSYMTPDFLWCEKYKAPV